MPAHPRPTTKGRSGGPGGSAEGVGSAPLPRVGAVVGEGWELAEAAWRL